MESTVSNSTCHSLVVILELEHVVEPTIPVYDHRSRDPEDSSASIQRPPSPAVSPDHIDTHEEPSSDSSAVIHNVQIPEPQFNMDGPISSERGPSAPTEDVEMPEILPASEINFNLPSADAVTLLDNFPVQEEQMMIEFGGFDSNETAISDEPVAITTDVPTLNAPIDISATSDMIEVDPFVEDAALEISEVSAHKPLEGSAEILEGQSTTRDEALLNVLSPSFTRAEARAMSIEVEDVQRTVTADSPTAPRATSLRARTRSPSLSPVPHGTSPMRMAPRPLSPPLVTIPAPEPMPELDPALLAFQNARTFRRRTAIQLQPYTREKTKYRAMVRKGGQLLIAELLHDDPDRVAIAKSLEETEESQFKESIEEEEDPEIDMAVSQPVTPDDKDYDEYFQLYGEVAEEASDPRLQLLAKTRLKEERRETRRKARQEREAERYMAFVEKELKAKERLRRLQEQADRRKSREESAKDRQEQARARLEERPNKPKRPVPKQRSGAKRPSDVVSQTNESEAEIQPHLKRRKLVRRAQSSEDQDDFPIHVPTGIEIAAEETLRSTRDPSQSFEGASSDWSGALSDIGDTIDFGGFADDDVPELAMGSATSPRIPLPSSRTINLTTPRSGMVEDAESDSSDELDAPREKVKVLKRVMPALLAKRLADKAEEDYQARQRRKALQAKEAEEARGHRPGQAVRRKANGPMLRQGVEGLFDDDSDVPVEDATPHFALERPPDPMITIFSSDDESEMLTQSDNLSDDDRTERHRRQQFEVGDFSRLLHGARRGERAPKAKDRSTTILKRTRSSGSIRKSFGRNEPAAQQNRIEIERSKAAQKKATVPKRPRRRVLDDAAIFELNSTPSVRPARDPPNVSAAQDPTPKRRYQPQSPFGADDRQTSRRSATPTSVGRALGSRPETPRGSDRPAIQELVPIRADSSDMWDELQEFQVDFAIKPLQAGITFQTASILGSGDFRTWIDYIEDGIAIPVEEDKIAVGLALSFSMDSTAFVALLPMLVEKIMEEVLGVMNDRTDAAESTTTGVFRFMISYVANAQSTDDHLRQIQSNLHSLEMRLKAITMPRSSRNQPQAFFLLHVKLLLVISVMVLFRADSELVERTAYDYTTTLTDTVSDLLESLLRYGFDRSMKPLKATMSLEAESGVIDDLSAECWVCLMHLTAAWDMRGLQPTQTQEERPSIFDRSLDIAIDRAFEGRQSGPRASERIWYLTLGLAAMSQFDRSGTVPPELMVTARWPLVRKAMGTLKIVSLTEELEAKKRYQLKPRDKYIKIMIIRCLQLTSIWRWHCNRESFAIATKDLGNVFRERALRNLPNESVGDFPTFIRQFDRTLAEEIDMEESAYNLYLQLVCLCASDIVTSPSDIIEARQAASDVKRLMLSIVPFSPVRFKTGMIPTGRQLSALINRFSTATVAAVFDITLLPYLLGNARKWIDFGDADIEGRTTCIRGLMYLGIAARHHSEPLTGVVAALSVYFETIQQEKLRLQTAKASATAILERERLLVLVVSSFKTMMTTHSFDAGAQLHVKYPDPELLAPCKRLTRGRTGRHAMLISCRIQVGHSDCGRPNWSRIIKLD
jgi:hypothetical protein